MKFYFRKKHQQLRDFREKYINQFLSVILVFLIGMVIGILMAETFLKTKTLKITNAAMVEAHAETAADVENVKREVIQTPQVAESPASRPQLDVESMIRREFGQDAEIALAIAKAESSLDPSRIGDKHLAKYSYGLFQINQIWHPYSEAQLLDPAFNIKIAKQIKDKYGWTQWTTYKTGQYLSNL